MHEWLIATSVQTVLQKHKVIIITSLLQLKCVHMFISYFLTLLQYNIMHNVHMHNAHVYTYKHMNMHKAHKHMHNAYT